MPQKSLTIISRYLAICFGFLTQFVVFSQESDSLKMGEMNFEDQTLVFVGSYTNGEAEKGIFIYSLDTLTGTLSLVEAGENLVNPSFITMSKDGNYLYACTETKLDTPGNVSVFSFDYRNRKLNYLYKRKSGINPVYLNVSKNVEFLLSVNYADGSLAYFDLDSNMVSEYYKKKIVFFESSGGSRQEAPHPHSIALSPQEDFAFIADLGADKIYKIFINKNSNTISYEHPVSCVKGSGPRHLIFHPNGKFVYCTEELSGTVSSYRFIENNLIRMQRVFVYSDVHSSYSTADIHISADGKFLYVSNRNDTVDNIAIYSIDGDSGILTYVGRQPTNGSIPRSFAIDKTGRFLIVANQSSGNIVVFRRDENTGLLKEISNTPTLPNPSSIYLR
jgi:6-phosphogluconolactonase